MAPDELLGTGRKLRTVTFHEEPIEHTLSADVTPADAADDVDDARAQSRGKFLQRQRDKQRSPSPARLANDPRDFNDVTPEFTHDMPSPHNMHAAEPRASQARTKTKAVPVVRSHEKPHGYAGLYEWRKQLSLAQPRSKTEIEQMHKAEEKRKREEDDRRRVAVETQQRLLLQQQVRLTRT